MGGYQFTSRDSDLLGNRRINRSIGDLPWAGLRVGVGLVDFLSIEGYAAFNAGSARDHDERAWVVQAGLEGIAHLLDGPLAIDLALGAGTASLVAGDIGTDTDFVLSAGAGIRWVFGNDRLALRADVRATFSDAVKGPLAVGGVLLLGFDVFVFRPDQAKDSDGGDADGRASPAPAAGGQMDVDGDGVPDASDRCPEARGPAAWDGCPDSDGDGMHDELDACPDHAGPEHFAGCPDSDGDGLPDTTDACPTLPGLEPFSGCPDTDDDGLPDGRDACPRLKGDLTRRGCPGPPESAAALFGGPLVGVRFVGETARLRPDAQPTIARVAGVLMAYPHLRVEIQAHSQGRRPVKKAWELTQDRAEAIKRQLVELGADPRTLTAVGMGPDHPIGSNGTRAGRVANDRVELHLRD